MAHVSRVEQLLEEILDSDRPPEDVCSGESAVVIGEVHERLRHVRRVEAQIAELFPPSGPLPLRFADAPTPLPEIPGYDVLAVVARGGMGVVYRARHLKLKRVVALKMLLAGSYASRSEMLRFTREAEAVAALTHPNIVQVYDVGESQGRPYFTMEYVPGGTLAQKLAGAPQPAKASAEMVACLSDAMSCAHRQGIIHRDLKPGNILLAADGTAKISDFGLARRFESDGNLTLDGVRVGTPSYMAPEQATGRPGEIGPAADVYALGAILYEMLTGRPPFRGESATETQRQVISEDPVPPSRLNPRVARDLQTICLTCLAKQPGRRYASAAALADDLRRFTRGECITARPVGRIERTIRWARRRPGVAASIVGAAVVTLILAGGVVRFVSDRAAVARAVEQDLREVSVLNRGSRWSDARAALDRASLRLGDRGPASLHEQLEKAQKDLETASQLEAIRTSRASASGAYSLTYGQANDAYARIFQEVGIGDEQTEPDVAAERIAASPIRPALVAALYDWMGCGVTRTRNPWLLEVARRADPDPTGWRDRALDPATWADPAKAAAVTSDAALGRQSVELLLVVRDEVRAAGMDPIPFLVRVQQAHPADYWANLALTTELVDARDPGGAIRYAQAAVVLRPDAALAHHLLGLCLLDAGRPQESVDHFREAARLDPEGAIYRAFLGLALSRVGRHEEAVRELEATSSRLGMFTLFRAALCDSLEALGRMDVLVEHYRQALTDPAGGGAWWPSKLRSELVRHGRLEEVLTIWRATLDAAPPAGSVARPWEGYAEYCLFLGRADDYRRASRLLLDRLGNSTDPTDCEYVGRTCLLAPPTDPNDLVRATALIDRALASKAARETWQYRFLRVARALADYRAGRYDAAIAAVEAEPVKVFGPTPGLIVAMSQWRLGRQAEARRALAQVAVSYDWSPAHVDADRAWIKHVLAHHGPRQRDDGDPWVYHILRREADAMILSELPAFREGRYEPSDTDERLAMTASCQFLELHAAHARLWAEAYASDPALATRSREYAVRAAALAGCGRGNDAAQLSPSERAQLRDWARQWFGAELDAAASAEVAVLDNGKLPDSEDTAQMRAKAVLGAWSASPDLAPVRDAAALANLPADEARQWTALWQRTAATLGPAKAPVWKDAPPPPPVDDSEPATQNSVRSNLSKKK